MNYEIVSFMENDVIQATNESGQVSWIPADEENSDYQKYLIDTDGGLPLPVEEVVLPVEAPVEEAPVEEAPVEEAPVEELAAAE